MSGGLWSELGRAYRGPLGWLAWLSTLYILLFFGVAIWAAVGLFRAETTRDQILLALAVLIAFHISALCKLWLYMLVNRNAIEDRLERIERRLEHS